MKTRAAVALYAALCAAAPVPVWIDTDPSMAPGGNEIDDGYALLQAFHSPELVIRGVSVVFGNAPLDKALPIGREFIRRFGPKDLSIYAGAAGARRDETDASRSLARALRHERLIVLALGPATNIATVLKNHPELGLRIRQVIAVAGRRPAQRFVIGHKKHTPFRDFNFELDPDAFQAILDAKVPLVLAPWEISSGVWLTEKDLSSLRTANDALAWLHPAALDWLAMWRKNFGTDGFNPFDSLAVAYVTSRPLLSCEQLPVAIQKQPDDRTAGGTKPYLFVGRDVKGTGKTEYCFEASPAFKDDLLRRLRRRN
jgi:inosine-uridine nucleoside N-ribohydrolase